MVPVTFSVLTPLVGYVAFQIWIMRENNYLEERYGDDSRKYRARVNELVPMPRR